MLPSSFDCDHQNNNNFGDRHTTSFEEERINRINEYLLANSINNKPLAVSTSNHSLHELEKKLNDETIYDNNNNIQNNSYKNSLLMITKHRLEGFFGSYKFFLY